MLPNPEFPRKPSTARAKDHTEVEPSPHAVNDRDATDMRRSGERRSPTRHGYWDGLLARKAAIASSSVAKMRSSPITSVSPNRSSSGRTAARTSAIAKVTPRCSSCPANSTRVLPPV